MAIVMIKLLSITIFVSILNILHAQNETLTLKFGTIAIEGSSWSNIFQELNAELRTESNDRLKFKFYYGRDEVDLLNMLKNKQLDAISITTVGLGKILSDISIFGLPLLFSSYHELDYARKKLTPRFEEYFSDQGYTLLGWTDYGIIYLFSKTPIRTQTDLQKSRIWVWALDPISSAFASASGREPTLLPLESVLPSLVNNEIQTVYNSPLACIVYQWYSQINFMTDFPLAIGVGGTILNRPKFLTLSELDKSLLIRISKTYHIRLIEKIRQDNEESLNILKSEGIKIISMPPQEKMKWGQIAVQVQNQFVGQLYEESLLNRIRDLINEFQSQDK
jgi:TRAP-type C4-dicarboxylate transport system substrate-binding protein